MSKIDDGDIEEELDGLAQYVTHDRLAFNHKWYKHSNRGVYKPLLKEIKNMGFSEHTQKLVTLLLNLIMN